MHTIKQLKIVIVLQWVHPEFGGKRTQTFEYSFREADKAELKYLKLLSETKNDVYSHVYITIHEELERN